MFTVTNAEEKLRGYVITYTHIQFEVDFSETLLSRYLLISVFKCTDNILFWLLTRLQKVIID